MIVDSVYYAKHVPRDKDVDPVPAVLIDNLYEIDRPDIKGIKYDFDGQNAILTEGSTNTSYWSPIDESEYLYNDKNNISYIFDLKFRLLRASNVDLVEES